VPIQGLNVTDRLLTVRQVAERLQVHPNTVKKLSIPFTRIGSVRRYHPAAVEKFLREHANRPQAWAETA
jgi:excisionase family DNA binding protein